MICILIKHRSTFDQAQEDEEKEAAAEEAEEKKIIPRIKRRNTTKMLKATNKLLCIYLQ